MHPTPIQRGIYARRMGAANQGRDAMSAPSRTRALAGAFGLAGASDWLPDLAGLFRRALRIEAAERRFFLWIPVAAMGGAALNLSADREPVLWLPALLTLAFAAAAFLARTRPLARGALIAFAALAAGFLSMGLRTGRVATPLIERIRIATLEGVVEELDPRVAGARFVLRITDAGDWPANVPKRVRLTMKANAEFAAGDHVALKARLLPPSRAVLPGGYDFARDAYFSGIGAVGSTLGAVKVLAPLDEGLSANFSARIDRARNALAKRVDTIIGGDEGAIAAAMVTGKRDFLSTNAKDLIREAGIFHVITISGVQMTLVAGIFFWTTRRLLALSPALALRYPIKKWAAGVAVLGALAYDVATGSRVGTERALIMTLIVFAAILLDRRALTMRNLALAVLAVVAMEPEAIAGVSFQLSFAAVAALIAVMEQRLAKAEARPDPLATSLPGMRAPKAPVGYLDRLFHKPLDLLIATACATGATASFMAYHFHDLSPYVLIGNPLTLSVIEFFAVPGAILGTMLYPLGLDGPVWTYLGFGIKFILWIAKFIAAAPASTVHLPAFQPYALPFLSLAVCSATIWRTWTFRALALPFALVGLTGATHPARYDLIIAPTGEIAAVRGADGLLTSQGKRFNAFAAEQWLAADGDARAAADAHGASSCDRLGCTASLPNGQILAIVADRYAFEEDCQRANVIVSALTAPANCEAPYVFDEAKLAGTGAVGLTWADGTIMVATDRGVTEDRPWSPAPRTLREERGLRPGAAGGGGADPADPSVETESPPSQGEPDAPKARR